MKLLRETAFRLLLLVPFLMVSFNSQAQSDPTGSSPATLTYAITNATIIPSPGEKIEGGTIIISDGLITAVGTNVAIPSNAEVIDGTDHYVYAGFIDGMSHTGAKRPESPERPDDIFTPDPPNFYAGITPELSVVDQLDVEENSINSMRKIGFTLSHTVPYGRMLPGKGSLILLRDGTHPDELVLKDEVSLLSQFVGAPGAYPQNTLGIMAKWRNIYRNAELAKNHSEMYASNPVGLPRPTQDRMLTAFYPVVEKAQPVIYNASSMLEAQRALRLQDEMGFRLILGNLSEGWPIMNELSGSDLSVFMTLDLPEAPENSEDDDLSDETRQLQERRQEFYVQHMEQFAAMRSAGLKFGFSTMGVTASKVKKNLIALQEFGFDSAAALAALTTDAADLLGISNIAGTLESGKLGNAIVTTGPYFQSNSNVKMVFVDGHKYEMEVRENTGAEVSGEAAAILGTWNYSGISPQGEISGTIIFSDETGDLTGVINSSQGIYNDVILTNIKFSEGTLTFDYSIDFGGQSLELLLTGEVDGDNLEGEISVPAFNTSFPVSATRENPGLR